MIDTLAALMAGSLIGGLAVALPDLVSDLKRGTRARRAEQSVVRGAEKLLRSTADD
jgi:hypothetical protein